MLSVIITTFATPISLGCLPSVVKIRNTGRKELVCPDEPQKSLTLLAKSLKTRPPHP